MPTTVDDLFPRLYINAEDLQGRKVAVTISRFEHRESWNQYKKCKETVTVLYFQGKKRYMYLNGSDARKIADQLGTIVLAEWIGKKISIQAVTGKKKVEVA